MLRGFRHAGLSGPGVSPGPFFLYFIGGLSELNMSAAQRPAPGEQNPREPPQTARLL